MNTSYKDLFAGNINVSIVTATSILASYPASAGAFIRIAKGIKDSENKRKQLANHVQIPPLMIVSTTEDCNLACTGCYSCAHNRKKSEELSTERIVGVLNEASDLGVSIVMLAGGEPLLSSGWLDALGTHDEIAGIVFTNGTLFDKNRIEWFSTHRHIIPALSIEGDKIKTDARRGKGVYDKVKEAMCDLYTAGIPFGVSITMWNICTQDLLRDSFKQEEKVLGDMNFSFILDRLLQRGLMLSGEANSDIEALHTLIDKKIVYAADVSLPSQVKMFFIMIIMMGVPVKHAKTVFKNYDLTAVERYALNLAKDKSMTTIELIHNLNLDDMSALMLISNLYLRKLIRFSEHKRGVCL